MIDLGWAELHDNLSLTCNKSRLKCNFLNKDLANS